MIKLILSICLASSSAWAMESEQKTLSVKDRIAQLQKNNVEQKDEDEELETNPAFGLSTEEVESVMVKVELTGDEEKELKQNLPRLGKQNSLTVSTIKTDAPNTIAVLKSKFETNSREETKSQNPNAKTTTPSCGKLCSKDGRKMALSYLKTFGNRTLDASIQYIGTLGKNSRMIPMLVFLTLGQIAGLVDYVYVVPVAASEGVHYFASWMQNSTVALANSTAVALPPAVKKGTELIVRFSFSRAFGREIRALRLGRTILIGLVNCLLSAVYSVQGFFSNIISGLHGRIGDLEDEVRDLTEEVQDLTDYINNLPGGGGGFPGFPKLKRAVGNLTLALSYNATKGERLAYLAAARAEMDKISLQSCGGSGLLGQANIPECIDSGDIPDPKDLQESALNAINGQIPTPDKPDFGIEDSTYQPPDLKRESALGSALRKLRTMGLVAFFMSGVPNAVQAYAPNKKLSLEGRWRHHPRAAPIDGDMTYREAVWENLKRRVKNPVFIFCVLYSGFTTIMATAIRSGVDHVAVPGLEQVARDCDGLWGVSWGQITAILSVTVPYVRAYLRSINIPVPDLNSLTALAGLKAVTDKLMSIFNFATCGTLGQAAQQFTSEDILGGLPSMFGQIDDGNATLVAMKSFMEEHSPCDVLPLMGKKVGYSYAALWEKSIEWIPAVYVGTGLMSDFVIPALPLKFREKHGFAPTVEARTRAKEKWVLTKRQRELDKGALQRAKEALQELRANSSLESYALLLIVLGVTSILWVLVGVGVF